MAIHDIKAVARELVEAHGRHDVQSVHELLSPKLKWHMVGVPQVMGRDDYLEGMQEGNKAFSDLSITVEDEVAEGDRVAQHWDVRMRHTGEFQGLPATNRVVNFRSVWFYRIVERKVVEAWSMDQEFTGMLK
ncbi:MAG TPA: ester cyclase [Polyangiaceae bacterium]|nr:ester cyclase [Polyangiaceae bacterium]